MDGAALDWTRGGGSGAEAAGRDNSSASCRLRRSVTLNVSSGSFGAKLDSLLGSLNIAHGHSSEFVMAVLGVVIVLVVGGLWRKRTRGVP